MKLVMFFLVILISLSCGRKSNSKNGNGDPTNSDQSIIAEIVDSFSYPALNQLQYEGQIIADLSIPGPTTTSAGVFERGTTLNVLRIKNKDFIVYGEDGVFAAECEVDADFPGNGPSHPLCETAHAESYDKIILCFSTVSATPILTAQEWPGTPTAMHDSSLGMECWVNGVKMKSKKVFTY